MGNILIKFFVHKLKWSKRPKYVELSNSPNAIKHKFKKVHVDLWNTILKYVSNKFSIKT